MSICKSIFNKTIYEMTLQDLESFFSSPQEETSILEFKSGRVAFEKVHVEVSAFLNTEGGLLIIGTPEETPNSKGIKVCQGSLTPCSVIKNLDILSRSIASNISPSPVGIKIRSIDCGDGNVFILEIPQSVTPPHQVDGKYYIRLERDAKAAPHGIVEALFFKRQKSNLYGDVGILVRPNDKKLNLEFLLKNSSVIHAEKIGLLLEVNGFKKINNRNNLRDNDLKDDSYNDQNINFPILVKEKTVTFKLEGELRFPFFSYQFDYYAQDTQLETISGIYDTKLRKYLYLKDTKHPENNINEESNIWELYSDMLKQEIRHFLQNRSNNGILNVPAKSEEISNIQHEMEVDFPISYFLLLTVSNVFEGYFDGKKFLLLSVEQLTVIVKSELYNPQYPVLIGEWADEGIFLDFSGDIATFKWRSIKSKYEWIDMDATSIFGLLEDIQETVRVNG